MEHGWETITIAVWRLDASGFAMHKCSVRTGTNSDTNIIRQKIERGDKAGLTARLDDDGVCIGYNNWGVVKYL